MCGLVGVYGAIGQKQKQAFYWLSHFDVIRGPHSFGITAAWKNKEGDYFTKVIKDLGTPENVYMAHPDHFDDSDLIKGDDLVCLIGHNRWATKGAITAQNAHPFEFDNLIGSHNGTLVDWYLRDFEHYKDFDVDSQVLYAEIDKKGIESTWKRMNGAAALTWWDKTTNTLNIARNNDRPLYYAVSLDNKTLYWASERWMLEVVFNKLSIKPKDIKHVPINRWFCMSQAANGNVEVAENALEVFTYPTITYKNSHNHPFQEQRATEWKTEVVEIAEYHQPDGGKAIWDGVFFGVGETGKEYRISTESTTSKKEWYEEIMNRVNVLKKPYYRIPCSAIFYRQGIPTIHYSQIYHLPHYLPPSKSVAKVENAIIPSNDDAYDDQYNRITYEDFKILCDMDTGQDYCRCAMCETKVYWNNIPFSVFLRDLDTVLCPNCSSTKMGKEIILDYSNLKRDELKTAV